MIILAPGAAFNAFAVCVRCFGCHTQVSVLGQLAEMNGQGVDSF